MSSWFNKQQTGAGTAGAMQSQGVQTGAIGQSGMGGGYWTPDVGTPSQSARTNVGVGNVIDGANTAIDWGKWVNDTFGGGASGLLIDQLGGSESGTGVKKKSKTGGSSYGNHQPADPSHKISLGHDRNKTQQHTVPQTPPQALLARDYKGSTQGGGSFDRGPTAQGRHEAGIDKILQLFGIVAGE